MNVEHEHDCKYLCVSCDRYFCEIKEEEGLPHDEELPEYIRTLSGLHFCHPDCDR